MKLHSLKIVLMPRLQLVIPHHTTSKNHQKRLLNLKYVDKVVFMIVTKQTKYALEVHVFPPIIHTLNGSKEEN